MSDVWLLRHAHEVDEDTFETKTIGIFSSEGVANAAIERLRPLPGFADYPNDFVLDCYRLDEVEWGTGFIKGFGNEDR